MPAADLELLPLLPLLLDFPELAFLLLASSAYSVSLIVILPVRILPRLSSLVSDSLADLDHLLRQLWPVRVMPLHISMSRSMVARAVMLSWLSRGVMRSIRASVS